MSLWPFEAYEDYEEPTGMENQREAANNIDEAGKKERRKVGTFDILKEMSSRGLDVRLSTLDNITDLEFKKGNSFIRIGFSGDVVSGITKTQFVGGMLLADKDQWNQIKDELERM
jgi:hypothetical protein